MNSSPGSSLRARIVDAADSHHHANPALRPLVKRLAPLSRAGDPLGTLTGLLRLTVGNGEARGVLVFEWPHRAAHHSALAGLDGWVAGSVDGKAAHGAIDVEYRDVVIDGTAGEEPASHLKVWFDLREIPDEMVTLLDLCARIGIGEAITRQLDAAPAPAPAVEATVEESPELEVEPQPEELEPELMVEDDAELDLAVVSDAIDRQAEPELVVDVPKDAPAEPVATAKPAPTPAPALDPAEQALVDAIVHNAVYDRSTHPSVLVNDEVTNSSGDVFRLVQKRVAGNRKRVWTRVTANVRAAS